jgi:hypothetical protein
MANVHSSQDEQSLGSIHVNEAMALTPEFTYDFNNFFHPFVGELIAKLNKESLPGLLDPVYQKKELTDETFFNNFYTVLPGGTAFKIKPYPKEIDVSIGGPYANYNWELFFHVPLTVAVHLSKNQRFAEAQRWFHYIFDPTCNDTSVPSPQRYWRFLAFRYGADTTPIDEQLVLLSTPDAEIKDSTQKKLKQSLLAGYVAIKDKPFHPHVVAQNRPLAYQYCVVMKYLDNLIAWGDSLFRQDTIESINEATQIYVLAANILGARPQRIPARGTVGAKSFKRLKEESENGLDPMGNALVELEGKFPSLVSSAQSEGTDPDPTGPLFGIGRTLYFCIPRNDKLLTYWDTVADRLFKLRHCMNIEGVVRQLALFDPPIDPGMLVKAAAAGIDIGSILSGLNQPIGPVRSLILIQKALELCGEVRGLGNALLSALEKGDAEHLALVRQRHEIQIQQMTLEVRFLQWKSAQEATTSLLTSRATALERLHYYKRLLNIPDDPNAPETLDIDHSEKADDPPKLTEENFDEAYQALVGQFDKALTHYDLSKYTPVGGDSPTQQSGAEGAGNLYLNTDEDAELNSLLPTARDTGLAASIVETTGAPFVFVPDAHAHLHFWGVGAKIPVPVGTAINKSFEIAARILRTVSTYNQEQAGMASKRSSYERRADEWLLQYNLAAHELMQIGRQILTSLIAEQIAHHEYLNIRQQIANAQEVDQFLYEKFTNEDLYLWMQGEISRLYYEYYRFAFDTARKAERTMKQELMRPEVDAQDFVKFNYWDGGRKGLLSGEALYLDIKRMEMAYHENNKREFELTKHISLRQLDPLALLYLKATGTCEFTVPEWLFDLDSSLYNRRIKTMSVSHPSVAGPYTSVSCTLSLLKSSVRKSPLLSDDGYARAGSEDNRFIDYYGTIQQIVTSSGQNDSGMFETNLRDERFLPFEGAGAISTWKLELPAAFRQFDYNTISDVILHMRYTARQGGALLGGEAAKYIEDLVADANAAGLALLFSLPHEFPNEWYRFTSPGSTANFEATVKRDYFPYLTQGKDITINEIKLYAIQDNEVQPQTPQGVVLADLSTALNDKDKEAFELSLAPDGDVLVRKKDAQVFLLIKYSIES